MQDEAGNATGTFENSEEIRKAFAELPFDRKLTTLFRIELDLVGDVAEGVASGVENIFKDVACWFSKETKAADSEGRSHAS
ncbi:MAG: hypothetical protein DMF61_00565 [Blastocatellia bacterium AA13]|nr:MAG: hypothetical protein DMF61_00565 [Blastocatellia bacterium AA13]